MRLFTDEPADGRRLLPDTGPSAIRYLLVLSACTIAVLVTITVTPSIGHAVRTSFCSTGDTACAQYAVPRAELGECRVISHADTVTDDAVVFTDDLGRSGTLTLSRTVDKNAVVHWFVRSNDTDGTGGHLTEFASEDAAREYITAAQHQPVRQQLVDADPTGLLGRLADRVDGHELVTRAPDADFLDGGTALDLSGEARSGVTGPRIGAGQSGIAEVKTADGASSLFVELSAAGTGTLNLLEAGSGVGPARPGLGVVSIAYDATGRADRLTIEAAGRLPQRLGPPFGSVGPQVMAGLLTPGPSRGGFFIGRVSISVSLEDPTTAGLAADALHAAGVPLLLDLGRRPASSTLARKQAVLRFYQLLDDGSADSSVTVNTYRTRADAGDHPTVALGLQGGLTVADALPDADYYYAAGQGFVEWQRCG